MFKFYFIKYKVFIEKILLFQKISLLLAYPIGYSLLSKLYLAKFKYT